MQENFDENTLFLTNKNGFPIDESTWGTMWRFAKFQYPDAKDKIAKLQSQSADEILAVKIPSAPLSFPPGLSTPEKVQLVQKYFYELQYNHTGTQFFEIKKYRGLSGLMDDAKLMVKESLPIKCLEAVVLGIYLTNKIEDLERFPIGFKSAFQKHTHRHVVLGLYSNGLFGALGISRRHDLMFKPMKFKSLTDLIVDFQAAYRNHWHTLTRVKIGGCVTRNAYSFETIPWRGLSLNIASGDADEVRSKLEKYSKIIRRGGSWQQQQQRLARSASMPGNLHRKSLAPASPASPSPTKTVRREETAKSARKLAAFIRA